MSEDNKQKVLDAISKLVAKPKMNALDGDDVVEKVRPANCFCASELYLDKQLGLGMKEVYAVLNSMVGPRKRLRIQNCLYFLK